MLIIHLKLKFLITICLLPIAINVCKYKINEYCNDSKSYLEGLDNWKNKLTNTKNKNKTLYVVTANVQGLHPNLCRD